MEDVETERDESSGQSRHPPSEHLLSFDMDNDNQHHHHHDIYYCPTSELEVVVPPFSLFHYDTDHSYISTTTSSNSNQNTHDGETRVVENFNNQSSTNDYIFQEDSGNTTIVSGLHGDEEFPELFDLYPYDVMQEQNNHEIEMGIGLQEQVIEISQNPRDYDVVRDSYESHPGSNPMYNDSKKTSHDKITPSILSPAKVVVGRVAEESTELESCDFEEDEEEYSSESEMEQQQKNNFRNKMKENKSSSKKVHKSGSQNNNHHVGQFPQTYIHLTSERRLRFCFGLQTIVTKIKALISRTGASADLRVWFEGHVFTLDNAEVKLYEFSNKSNKKILNGFVYSGTIIPTTTSNSKATNNSQIMMRNDSKSNLSKQFITNGNQEVEDDHRYAATILKQTESSQSVRDHQYNEISTKNNNSIGETSVTKMNKGNLIEKTYIKTRYARERWLRNSIKTLYSKMQRLINRTGARMTLCVKYQGIMITQKNYKDLESILGKSRPQLKKYPTAAVIEKQSDTNKDIIISSRLENVHNQDSEVGENNKSSTKKNPPSGTIMRILIPGASNPKPIAMNSSDKSLKIEFLKIDKTSSGFNHSSDLNDDIGESENCSKKVSDPFLQSIITSDHDYIECTRNDTKNNTNNSSSGKNFTESPSNSFKGNSKEIYHKSFGTDFNNVSCQMSPSLTFCHSVNSTNEEVLVTNDNLNTSLVSKNNNVKVKISKNEAVTTNVDVVCCQLCGGKNIIKEGGTEKYPMIIRCSHPLCAYLVHPSCLGFLVMNSQQLQFLPPFFCPRHRNNIIGVD